MQITTIGIDLAKNVFQVHGANEHGKRLEKVPGIGPLTATAIAATVGDAKNFDNGRQLAAWLGLVPRQSSSGGKATLLGMSKRGDAYLRTLLIHGARSVIYRANQRADAQSWLTLPLWHIDAVSGVGASIPLLTRVAEGSAKPHAPR